MENGRILLQYFTDCYLYLGQAVCKLPFIDESRLLREIESLEHTLTVTYKSSYMFLNIRLFQFLIYSIFLEG